MAFILTGITARLMSSSMPACPADSLPLTLLAMMIYSTLRCSLRLSLPPSLLLLRLSVCLFVRCVRDAFTSLT